MDQPNTFLRAALKFGRRVHFALQRKMRKPNNLRVTVDDIREWKAGVATLWVRVNVSFGSHSANVITDSRLAVMLLLPVHSLPFCASSETFSIRSHNTDNSPDYAQLSYGCGCVMIS